MFLKKILILHTEFQRQGMVQLKIYKKRSLHIQWSTDAYSVQKHSKLSMPSAQWNEPIIN